MNNPYTKFCRKDRWKKIASSVTEIYMWSADRKPGMYLYTYRLTGESAPISSLEGQPVFIEKYFEHLKFSVKVDIYIMAVNNNGSVRVNVINTAILHPLTDEELRADAVENIDYNHNKIHEGFHFFYSRFHIVASGATINFAFEAGAKSVHFVYAIDSDFAGFTYSSYKDVTYTAGTGTPLDIRNNNSIFADNLTTSKLILNPTGISIVGAATYRTASKGTATNPAKSSGGSLVREDEVIFKPNTKWLLAITNKATADNPINVGMSWYEN